MSLLSAIDLSVTLGGSGARPALQEVSARFGRGWTAVVGPNGAGKSTLLRALAGLLRPQAGAVLLEDRPLAQWPASERARRVAWLAQQGEVSGELTVRETVGLGRIAHLGLLGTPLAADEAAVQRAMAMTECESWSGRRLQQLSGGERQRVLLARVLATEAPLLLLDEPTTHVDAPHQVALARLIRELVSDAQVPRGVVSVLHDLPVALLADRLVVMDEGRIRADGAVTDAAVSRTLVEVFRGAIRIEPDACGRPRVTLDVDGGR